jgi:hypothetical protein
MSGTELAEMERARTVIVAPAALVYSRDRIDAIVNEHSAFLAVKRAEIDGLYEQVVDGLATILYGNDCGAVARVGIVPPARITPAIVMAVATIGAFEWLRHRKAEVAAAEKSGEWKSLTEDFWDWVAQLFRFWRGETE